MCFAQFGDKRIQGIYVQFWELLGDAQQTNNIMMGANILPLPAQLSSRSASSNPTRPSEFTGTPSLGVSISNLITRSPRRHTVCIENQIPKRSRRDSIFKKLARPRENAKRFLRLRSSGVQAPSQRLSVRPVSEIILSPISVDLEDEMRSDSSSTEVLPRSVHEPHTVNTDSTTPFTPLRNEKIVATGSGISVGIALTEPVLFLQGYDQQDPSSKKSAILRGQMHLKITKCVKIKKISICFRGHAQTDWPDGENLQHQIVPEHELTLFRYSS